MTLNPLFPTEATLGINTDLYELTMAAAFFQEDHADQLATFELFTRELPSNRGFLIAAGLEQALHYALNVRFSSDVIAYLNQLEIFSQVESAFFDYLRGFRFSGEIRALPEGTIFFADEPIIQVTAPIIEAQILETFLINSINVQSMVASKAVLLCDVAGNRAVIDFGSRRAHGPQTGVLAARAAFIGGCEGTSNVLAGFEMDIPVFGTMAHSFVQFFSSEIDAFRCFSRVFPHNTILVVDTYDSIEGVKKTLNLKSEIAGVRLDSGDLSGLAFQVRELLDSEGRSDVKIFASGNLNETKLEAFTRGDVPIDGYGLGTDLVVSADAPTCDLVYKLVEVVQDGQHMPRFKTSQGKASIPYRKQVYRFLRNDTFVKDLVARYDERPAGDRGECKPLLQLFVENGTLVEKLPTLTEVRALVRKQLRQLPASYKNRHTPEIYPVDFTPALKRALE